MVAGKVSKHQIWRLSPRKFRINHKKAKLQKLIGLNNGFNRKGLFMIGYEHNPARISLDPLIDSFELIARKVLGIPLGQRVEEKRDGLVHPEHQVLRCAGWELIY